MQPVSRSEWASPLTVGKHAREFLSALPESPTKEVLSALRSDPKLLSVLERSPLGRLELSDRVPMPNWYGSYDPTPHSRDLVVNAFRGPDTYGKPFDPRTIASVSQAGRNLPEAMQRSLYHELGHHLLEHIPMEALDSLAGALRSRQVIPVSVRARRNPGEYFSETFTAYRFEDSLADKDPVGYDMIEAILGMIWQR